MNVIETVESTPVPRERRPGPWHRRVHGLSVLKVRGSFRDMGRQHGEMLRTQIPAGPVPMYRRHVKRLMGESFGPLSPVVFAGLQQLVGRRVAAKMPDFARETIRGLSEGSGIPYERLLEGYTMPDSLLWLASRLMQVRRPGPAVAHRLRLGLGCTSAIAWGDATVDGRLLHARNFDYYGVSSWPGTAAVVFHEPDEGQRYVSVAAAGICLGGITAMNEAGMSMTVHQHMFTDRARLGGTPIGVVGDIVMREATSLDEAQRILEAHRPIGCWAYLVTDARRREVLCWEESPDRRAAIRTSPEDTTFGYANVFLDPELGATEVNLYGSYWRHNEGRYRRANELLEELHGRIDPQAAASILADTGDPRCRIRDSIAMVMTVGSVVFRPEDGVLWVGTGETPTSHGTFVPFDLHREDHAPEHGTLETGTEQTREAREAFDAFRRAYVAYLEEGDLPGAARACERAAELCPDQPVYQWLAGMMRLVSGHPGSALEALSRAIELGHPDPERLAGFHLWRARALDLLGRRDEARRDYRTCLGLRADAPVHAAARRGLARPWRQASLRRVHVDFAFADVMNP